MSSQENGQVPVFIKFTVYGEPVAQGRPRFARMGNNVKTYDPEKSVNYKEIVRAEALKVRPQKPLAGAISLVILIYRSIPKSFSKKRTIQAQEGYIRPITRPDIDNIVKGIKDSLKGVIWKDDSQVITLTAKKYYSDVPRIEVAIGEF